MNWLLVLLDRIYEALRGQYHTEIPLEPPTSPVVPVEQSKSIPMPDYLDTILPWTTQKNYYHNVGVLCDRSGLTFSQKDIIRRCIWIESRFRDYYEDGTPVVNPNKDKTGSVWSRDWGLVQINDYPKWKHIGPGCMFSSVEDVLAHPERSAQFMIDTMKKTGKLQPWASYTTGVYKTVPTSALNALKS